MKPGIYYNIENGELIEVTFYEALFFNVFYTNSEEYKKSMSSITFKKNYKYLGEV
jgi:hypothetical protein